MSQIQVFESWEDFRSKSEFFPAGKIVPHRIMDIRTENGRRFKFHHRFVFGADVWIYRTVDGVNVIAAWGGERACSGDECIMHLRSIPRRGHCSSYGSLTLRGAPYAKANLLYNPIAPVKDIEKLNAYLRGDEPASPIKA